MAWEDVHGSRVEDRSGVCYASRCNSALDSACSLRLRRRINPANLRYHAAQPAATVPTGHYSYLQRRVDDHDQAGGGAIPKSGQPILGIHLACDCLEASGRTGDRERGDGRTQGLSASYAECGL